ncbi:TonB-dependent vitamin B12 receptor [Solilutibacter tolerans]|uniref:Vitamin B12 transporter n=1 Tax=Solilutibacter tolerans TaxID=1604334 RepID=A0A1N6NFX2_9GAMM|nr:TonB-dependent vitamin B12 receptor [Lysobacter tolerans]SIP90886.1 vitamin B12 transporter [Lysobacter tolerans]
MSARSILTQAALAVAISHAFASIAIAQDASAQSLDRVVVTGTRSERGPDTLAARTVIEREEIERLQPASLQDLLRGQTGLAIYNQGGAGKVSGLFLRGTSPGQVLVLVDGVKIGSPTNGMAAVWDIPVSQIERVEIVRGPLSSLYGSEAVGGVIQIFTRGAGEPGVHPEFGVAIGSEHTYKADAGIRGRTARGWYSAGVAHEEIRGFNACNGDPVTFAGCGTIEPDRDGYRNDSVRLAGGIDFNQQWQADARLLRAEGKNEFDGGWANENENVQQVAGAHVRYAPSETFALHLNAGRNDDDSRSIVGSTGMQSGRITTQRDTASLQADIGGDTNLLSVGFDWQRDEVEGTTVFDVDHRISRALFGQWRTQSGNQHFQTGLRREDNSQFGGATTGNAAWGWDFTEALRLTASYGTAFRAPTFNDLYYPGFSNPNLRPERSRSIELGVEGRHGWGEWSLRGYQNRLRDLIVYNPMLTSPSSPYGMPDNVQLARVRGLEAMLGLDIAGWDVNATASFIDPRNETPGSLDGKQLNRRPKRMARIDADRDFGRYSLGASVNGNSARFDDPANRVRMGGYATTDLRAGLRMSDAWRLQLMVANVFDRQYETARWYNQAGRTWLLSLRWQPGQ